MQMKSLEQWQQTLNEITANPADKYVFTGGVKTYLNWLIEILEKNAIKWSLPKKAQILVTITRALGFANPIEAMRAMQLANQQLRRGIVAQNEPTAPEPKADLNTQI